VPTTFTPIADATLTALRAEATRLPRDRGPCSPVHQPVRTTYRLAALLESLHNVADSLTLGGWPDTRGELIRLAAVAMSWAQCWSCQPHAGWSSPSVVTDDVLHPCTVADLVRAATLCARPGNEHCQLHDLPAARRLALLTVEVGKVAGWLARDPYEPSPQGRAHWLTAVTGALIHTAATALLWADYLGRGE
jgi:hypothetical protein